MLRSSQDASAPSTALELVVKKHSMTLSFSSESERDGFLRVWISKGVPHEAVPMPLFEQVCVRELSSLSAAPFLSPLL